MQIFAQLSTFALISMSVSIITLLCNMYFVHNKYFTTSIYQPIIQRKTIETYKYIYIKFKFYYMQKNYDADV